MAEGFDFMKFAGDVGKGVCDAAGNVGKGLCDVAGGAVGAVAGAVVGAADAVGGAVAQAFSGSTPPAAQYGENMHKGGYVDERTIQMCRVGGKDFKGHERPDRDQAIRMSKNGIELLAGQEFSSGVVRKLSVRNCAVYANGKTEPGNPLLNAVGGGWCWGVVGGAVNPALAPVGAVAGAVAGFAKAFETRDVWYIDILEYDGTEWTFRLDQKSDGDDVIKFLDEHFAL